MKVQGCGGRAEVQAPSDVLDVGPDAGAAYRDGPVLQPEVVAGLVDSDPPENQDLLPDGLGLQVQGLLAVLVQASCEKTPGAGEDGGVQVGLLGVPVRRR